VGLSKGSTWVLLLLKNNEKNDFRANQNYPKIPLEELLWSYHTFYLLKTKVKHVENDQQNKNKKNVQNTKHTTGEEIRIFGQGGRGFHIINNYCIMDKRNFLIQLS
jgi:hypothetical protein